MTSPTHLESKAVYVAKKLSNHRISAARVLEAMLEWNKLPREEKARYSLPQDNSWSIDELNTLQRLWASDILPQEIMEALPERSYAAITAKAHKEGIRRPPEYLSKCRAHRL